MTLLRYDAEVHRAACLRLFDGNVGTAFLPEEREGFASFLEAPPGEYFVLLYGSAVVACGGIAFENAERSLASVCWTIVARDHLRGGFGRAILDACVAAADEEARCDTVRLDTTHGAEGFFQRFGFETVDVEPDGYGPGLDKLEMRRTLRR